MKITSLKKSKDIMVLLIEGSTSDYVNTLRRSIMAEVPTMAIEDVEFRQNDSVLYDEMMALRLGLLPIKTDLKSYSLSEECDCKGAGCAKCSLKMTLKATGAKQITAGDIKSKDPKIVPVYSETPIVNLLENQKLEFEATAIMGKGKNHMKWSPGLASFRGVPIITAGKNADKEIIKKNSKILSITGNNVKILNHLKYNGSLEQDLEENGFEIDYSDTDFIFTLESWGQLKTTTIFEKAIEEYDNILSVAEKQLKTATK
jgi:DNA-directed RNA polymerase subunit D